MSPTNIQLLQIIPQLPPAICGVGDHARAIGQELSGSHGYDVNYLAVNAAEVRPAGQEYHALEKRTAPELVSALRSAGLPHGASILLHFSGYSYGSRGICFWLIKGLKKFLNERPDVKLISMFHELWSPARLLSQSGWVVPVQKSVVRKLVEISSVVRTNRVEYQRQIERLCPSAVGRVGVNNICSNFGEPEDLPPISERKRQILIFQPPDCSTPNGRFFWERWGQLRDQLGGLPTVIAGRIRQVPADSSIELRGFVSKEEGSQLMSESQFAYFEYFDGYLGKSSLFGSLAAHGIVPVMPSVNHSELEGVVAGIQYLTPNDRALNDVSALNRVSIELQRWYATHSITATAADYDCSMSSQTVRKCA